MGIVGGVTIISFPGFLFPDAGCDAGKGQPRFPGEAAETGTPG
jgi:hypothetical protein